MHEHAKNLRPRILGEKDFIRTSFFFFISLKRFCYLNQTSINELQFIRCNLKVSFLFLFLLASLYHQTDFATNFNFETNKQKRVVIY